MLNVSRKDDVTLKKKKIHSGFLNEDFCGQKAGFLFCIILCSPIVYTCSIFVIIWGETFKCGSQERNVLNLSELQLEVVHV